MNENTISLIKKYYAAFNAKDYQGMLDLLSEDISHDINQGKRIPGKKAFREFLERMDFFYDENLSDIVIMTDESGKRAAAEFICNGIYKNSDEGLPPAKGQKYTLPVGCFFEIKNGKIARVTNYYNMNDWIQMVNV